MAAANIALAKPRNVTNPMKRLYARLGNAGLSRKFIQSTVLPSWWDDEAAENVSGYAEALLLLSRHLGLDLASLQNDLSDIAWSPVANCKFKKTGAHSEEDVALARALALRATALAVEAMTTPLKLPPNAAEIRQNILNDAPYVSLESLTAYCWSIGIPVLHLSNFPPSAKKPDGLASMVGGRPVIVICKNQKYSAWLLFILAHELGHIVRGHIQSDGVLVDDKIADEGSDSEEGEANDFAVELLTGRNTRYRATGTWPNAIELANEARRISQRELVDPGHIVLNYAHAMNEQFFPVANAALKILEPNANAPMQIRKIMAAKLDWSRLPEDSSEFLMRITETKAP